MKGDGFIKSDSNRAGKKIKEKEVTVAEAVKAALARAKAVETDINSYVTLDEAGALAQAEAVQKKSMQES